MHTRSLWFLFLFLHKKQDAAQMTALYATPCCCVGGWRYNYVYYALYLHYSHADSSLQQCQCPFLFATPPSWRLCYFSTPRTISLLIFFFFFFEPWIWKHTDSIMNKRIKFLQSISNYNIITVFQIRGMFKHLHLLNCFLNFQKRFFFHFTDLRYHLFFFDECRIYHFQIIS